MKKPTLANQTDQLIETLLELQKLAADAQEEKLRAIDLRKAYELLREHRPHAKCTKACLDEVLALEYKARTLSERLIDRMKTLLLSSAERAQVAEQVAEQATEQIAKQTAAFVAPLVAKPLDVAAQKVVEDLPIYQAKRGCQRKPHIAVTWLEAHSMEFPRDEWIAVDGFELVASDSTIAGLMQKLERRRVPFPEVCILYNESLAAGIAAAVD